MDKQNYQNIQQPKVWSTAAKKKTRPSSCIWRKPMLLCLDQPKKWYNNDIASFSPCCCVSIHNYALHLIQISKCPQFIFEPDFNPAVFRSSSHFVLKHHCCKPNCVALFKTIKTKRKIEKHKRPKQKCISVITVH